MPPKKQPKQQQQNESSNKRTHEQVKSEGGGLSDAQATMLLEFMLSPDIVSTFGSDSSTGQKTTPQLNLFDFLHFSKDFTPFQSLVAALVMSKPISSRLGVRTVFTLFSGKDFPGWDHPKTMLDAGDSGRYEALAKAKTQHKDKTAAQLGNLCQLVLDEFAADADDTELTKLRDLAKEDPEALEKSILKINGVGKLAVEVFKRRVQASWADLYPFADERCLHAADYFGFDSQDAKSFADHVQRLLPADSQKEQRKRFAFIVEAFVAADLEHKLDDLLDRFSEQEEAGEPTKKAKKDEE